MDIGGEDKMKKIGIEKQIVFIFLLFTAFFYSLSFINVWHFFIVLCQQWHSR